MKKELTQTIRRAKVSFTAREVMHDLLLEVTPQRPLVYVNLSELAQSVGRKESTVQKALRELVNAGFLSWDGQFVSSVHKVYKILFEAAQTVVQKVKEGAAKVVRAVKKAISKAKEEPLNAETKEVLETLKDFGFSETERNEVLQINGTQKTRDLVLEYLALLQEGETMPVKDWFIVRYIKEREANGSRIDYSQVPAHLRQYLVAGGQLMIS